MSDESVKPGRPSVWSVLKPIAILVGVVLAFSVGYVLIQNHRDAGDNEKSLVKVGIVVPDFAGKKAGAKKAEDEVRFSTIAAKKKLIMVNFWATWCEACVVEMPSIVQTWNQYKDRGFEVIAVSLDQKLDGRIEKMAKDLKMDFPILVDEEGNVADFFDVHAIPLTVILDPHGEILLLERGERDWNSGRIREKIEGWLAAKAK